MTEQLTLLGIKPPPATRYSCRCTLCRKAWTAHDPADSFDRHIATCGQSQAVERDHIKWYPNYGKENIRAAVRRQCFAHQRIKGHYHPETKCNAKCTSATGPDCSCSCGGANHGGGAEA
jgi:hypothetical protein